jgi:hypothetical protein
VIPKDSFDCANNAWTFSSYKRDMSCF